MKNQNGLSKVGIVGLIAIFLIIMFLMSVTN